MVVKMNQSEQFAFSRTLVTLFRSIIYKETNRECWNVIEAKAHRIEDYVGKMGLTIIIDEMDGYAYLKQRNFGDDEESIPRLIPRQPLSYELSLLLMVLRKQLMENDKATGDVRLVLTRQQIIDRMKPLLRETTNEVKLIDSIARNIDRAVNMGFLTRLKGSDDSFEVMRIIRGFINAENLEELNKRISEYQRYTQPEENAKDFEYGDNKPL